MQHSLRVEIIETIEELRDHREPWRQLALNASSPNVFYEPSQMIAAMEHLDHRPIRHLFVWRRDGALGEVLAGYIPLELKPRLAILGLPALQNWRPKHCYYGAPLIARGYERAFWRCFLVETSTLSKSGAYIRLIGLAKKSDLFRALVRESRQLKRTKILTKQHCRPFLIKDHSFEEHLQKVIGKNTRKSIRQRRSRLEALGRMDIEVLGGGKDLNLWIEDFFDLEARGWKGRNGTAIAQSASDENYFRQIMRDAHRDERLAFIRIRLDHKTIAALFNVTAATGHSFALKTAYDEAYRDLAPGFILEAEYLRLALDEWDSSWTDSCADGENQAIVQLWRTKREIVSVSFCHDALISKMLVRIEILRRFADNYFLARGRQKMRSRA